MKSPKTVGQQDKAPISQTIRGADAHRSDGVLLS